MKEKILYVSHIDWNWIKQRPQFIAEQLQKYFDVTVVYMFQNTKRKSLQKRSHKGEKVFPLFSIPFAGRFGGLLGSLNKFFMTMQVHCHMKRVSPQYIYLTHPLQLEFLPKSYFGKIIYDCMDNHIALGNEDKKEKIALMEKQLIERADYILVSSNNLIKQLINRYGAQFEQKMSLVRNGYNGEILQIEDRGIPQENTFTLSYIGTVGSWFNFDFVIKSLEDIPNLRYKIIGPLDVQVPQSERIEYAGTIEHDKLYSAIRETSCLVMPFMLNEIVEAVDPVKLYEYINYNMNVLCVKYDEVERFSPFVHFYTDYVSYKEQIELMMENNTLLYKNDLREKFLTENSWSARVETIKEIVHR